MLPHDFLAQYKSNEVGYFRDVDVAYGRKRACQYLHKNCMAFTDKERSHERKEEKMEMKLKTTQNY